MDDGTDPYLKVGLALFMNEKVVERLRISNDYSVNPIRICHIGIFARSYFSYTKPTFDALTVPVNLDPQESLHINK